jgi:hypothetical protein
VPFDFSLSRVVRWQLRWQKSAAELAGGGVAAANLSVGYFSGGLD